MQKTALLVFVTVVGVTVASSSLAQTGPFEPRYHPSRVIVWFKPGAVTLPAGITAATLAHQGSFSPSALSALNAVGAVNVRMLTPTATAENLVSEVPGALPETAQLDMHVVELPDTNVASALATLNGDPSVVVAEPDWEKHACLVPTDSRFSQQWWLKNTGQFGGVAGFDINATQAWDVSTGASPVDVVVIDTGVDGGHPDLLGRVYGGPNYIFPTPPDDDDVFSSHGTSVSGIIAAQGNGGGDVVGVDWNARIIAVKALDGPSGGGSTSDIDAAVDWARVNGYKLVNLSLGGPSFLRTEQVVFKNAHAAGVTCCVAMGNENSSLADYPAGYAPYVVAVGAVDDRQNRWDDHLIWPERIGGVPSGGLYFGSNTGLHIRLAAPGGRLIETTRSVATGGYWPVALATGSTGFGGTSAATPVVTGVAALVKSLAPQLTAEDLAQVLYLSAYDFNKDTPGLAGFDNQVGYGLVDAAAAVEMVSGQNRVEQGATVSVADVAQQNNIWRSILSWPGIQAENYPCIRHTIRATVSFATPFISPPAVWARRLSSYGAGNENPIYDAVSLPNTDPEYGNPALVPWRPNAWPVSVSGTQATFETYVYDLRDINTSAHRYWWPTTPSGVSFAYTAVGPVSLLGVPHGTLVVDEVRLSASPNPAGHGPTTLTLSVPRRGDVSLEIHDVSGRLVRALVSATLSPGVHRYTWDMRGDDGQTVPAGLYFARCSASGKGEAVSRIAVVR